MSTKYRRSSSAATPNSRASQKTIFTKAKDFAVTATKARYTSKGKVNVGKIASDIALLSRLMNTEEKSVDTLASPQTVQAGTSLVYGVGTMAQGTSGSTREGDSIKITRIDYILQWQACNTLLSQDVTYRWFYVQYLKTPSSSGTTAFNISEFLAQDAGSAYTSISFPNTDTNQNFKILAQGTQLVTGAQIVGGTATRIISGTIDCNFHQIYNGAAATTITDNMCFFVCVSDKTMTSVSTVSVQTRMWFVDN